MSLCYWINGKWICYPISDKTTQYDITQCNITANSGF